MLCVEVIGSRQPIVFDLNATLSKDSNIVSILSRVMTCNSVAGSSPDPHEADMYRAPENPNWVAVIIRSHAY